MPGSTRLTIAAFVGVVLLGGFNAIGIRFSNVELPPFLGAATRFGLASLLLFLIVGARRLPLPRGRALLGAVIYGVLGLGLSFALGYWALMTVQAGLAQVILSLVPLLTFFFAIAHRQERFRWRGLVGALVATAGIFVVFRDQMGSGAPLIAMLAMAVGAACIAESTVIVKGFPTSHPVTTNAVAMAAGAMLQLGFSFLAGEAPAVPKLAATWAAVFYLVVVGSVVVFALYLYVLKRLSASVTSYQFVLLPFVAVASGAWLAQEAVSLAFVLGGALVLVGVYVGALSHPAPRPSAEVVELPRMDRAA